MPRCPRVCAILSRDVAHDAHAASRVPARVMMRETAQYRMRVSPRYARKMMLLRVARARFYPFYARVDVTR